VRESCIHRQRTKGYGWLGFNHQRRTEKPPGRDSRTSQSGWRRRRSDFNKVEQLLAANREYQLRIAGLSAENATLREQIVTLMSERDTAQVHELDRAIRSSLIASAEEVRSLRYAAKDIGTTAEKLRRESERLTQYAPLPLETHQRIVREPDPVTEERLKRMEASYLRATQEKEKLLRLFTETVGHPPDDF
jgi:hypothetical protein